MSRAVTYLIVLTLCSIPFICMGQAGSISKGDDSIMVTVEKLTINSPQNDFAPFRCGNTLYFVSGRVSQLAVQYSNENNETEITDIYQAAIKDPTKPRDVKAVDKVNSRYHEGPLTVNRKGDRMYLTASDKNTKRLKLFGSQLVEGEWTKPTLLSFCADTFSYCHPALSVSEDTLYFSSNCCGAGKMDICYAKRYGDAWGPVLALDTLINGKTNEVFPFVGTDGRFYFASDRPGGAGGFDIYRRLLNDRSRRPYPLDPPFNSAADDFGIWCDSTGQSGYFSSNRASRTGDDVYYFGRSIPDFSDSELVPAPKSFCYEFIEENSPAVNDTISLSYYWSFGDGESGTGIQTHHCYAKPGTYNIELNVISTSLGYSDTTLVEYKVEIEEPDHLHIDAPDTVNARSEIKFSSSGSKLKNYEITETYWSFGDRFFKEGAEAKHAYKKEGKYTVQLWVIALNTKDRNTKKFRLSKEIVVNYAR